jgi:hypothetical protein
MAKKYVRMRSGEIRTTARSGHHKNLAKKKDVVSAGRYTKDDEGKVRTYSKSYGLKKYPAKGDARRLKKVTK